MNPDAPQMNPDAPQMNPDAPQMNPDAPATPKDPKLFFPWFLPNLKFNSTKESLNFFVGGERESRKIDMNWIYPPPRNSGK